MMMMMMMTDFYYDDHTGTRAHTHTDGWTARNRLADCGPEVLFETCVAMKLVDYDDDDDEDGDEQSAFDGYWRKHENRTARESYRTF